MTTPSAPAYLGTAGPGPVKQWNGVYTGVVVNNNDPAQQSRVQMQVPQVLGTAYSTWCSPTLPPVPGSLGPNVGTQLYVMFNGGDPDYPVYLGAASLNLTGSASMASLAVTGAVSAASLSVTGNIASASLSVTGNISSASLSVTGNIASASLNVTGNITSGSLTTGTLSATSITLSGSLSAASVTTTGTGTFNGGVKVGATTVIDSGTNFAGLSMSLSGGIQSASIHTSGLGEFSGGVQTNWIEPDSGSLVTMYYDTAHASFAGYWTSDGVHVTQSLWGTGGVLTIGDKVSFFGGAESIHCSVSPGSGVGQFDGGILAGTGVTPPFQVDTSGNATVHQLLAGGATGSASVAGSTAHFTNTVEADGGLLAGAFVGGVAPFQVDTSGNITSTGSATVHQLLAGGAGGTASVAGSTAHFTNTVEADGGLLAGTITGGVAPFTVDTGGNIVCHQVVAGGVTTSASIGGTSAHFTAGVTIDTTLTLNQVVAGGVTSSSSVAGTTAHFNSTMEADGGVIAFNYYASFTSTPAVGTLYYANTPSGFAAYWDSTGLHVASTLYGNAGVLSIGDKVSFGAGAEGIHCSTTPGSGIGQFDGGVLAGSGGTVPFQIDSTGAITACASVQVNTTNTSRFNGPVVVGLSGASQNLTLHGQLINASGNFPTTAPGGWPIASTVLWGPAVITVLNNLWTALGNAGIW